MATIEVYIRNQWNETESKTTVTAESYAAAAKKARAWLANAGIKKPTTIYKSKPNNPFFAVWIYKAQSLASLIGDR